MGAGVFWGIIFILIGLSIVFKVFFDISLIRIVIAIAFILIGMRILMGKTAFRFNSNDKDVLFGERYYTEFPLTNTEYNTIFGKSVYNYSEAAIPTNKTIELEFNTIFGNTQLILPPGLPVKIKGEAVFGAVRLPNDNTAVFGETEYSTDQDSAAANFTYIKASAVFGNIDVIQKRFNY